MKWIQTCIAQSYNCLCSSWSNSILQVCYEMKWQRRCGTVLFRKLLTLIFIQGCSLSLNGMNFSWPHLALSATSKTLTILLFRFRLDLPLLLSFAFCRVWVWDVSCESSQSDAFALSLSEKFSFWMMRPHTELLPRSPRNINQEY